MTTTNVKYFHSGMTGAPALSGQAGKLLDVLDACLVNGFGSGTVDSVVIAGGIATVTRSGGHPFEVDTIALIAGATVTGGSINGEKRVLSAAGTTYTFDATGIADQTATGTITHKLASLDWAKPFSGTNLAAYKPNDVAATGCLLRVDDTGTNNARVVGYESMSGDINGGVGPFPTAAQVSGGGYWGKSLTADATTRAWALVGDSRGFFLYVGYNTVSGYAVTHGFGDLAPTKPLDPYGCCLTAASASYTGSTGASLADCAQIDPTSFALCWIARGVSGLGTSSQAKRVAQSFGANAVSQLSGANSGAPAFPNAANNALYVVPIGLTDGSAGGAVYRGVVPGLMFAPMYIGSIITHLSKIGGVTGLTGRKLLALQYPAAGAVAFVDITGPWAR